MSFPLIILAASLLVFICLLSSVVSPKLGAPVSLAFLLIGMIAGRSIHFEDVVFTQQLGNIALCIILFSGGVETKYGDIKPVFKAGISLSTLGVMFTALITGFFVWWLSNYTVVSKLLHFSFIESLLLASIVASTDAASVFAILRSKSIGLKQNLKPLIEFESGSNDPVAFLFMITLIQILTTSSSNPNTWMVVGSFFYKFIASALIGFVFGKLFVWVNNKIKLSHDGLHLVLMIIAPIFIFSFSEIIHATGYLAVYIGGLVIGNSKLIHKKSVVKLYDGLSWLFQIIIFLLLGVLVNYNELLEVFWIGLIIAMFLILFGRPISVFLSLLPFRNLSLKARTYVSWVGLRGAVPIIFATYPLAAGLPCGKYVFNIVFLITIVSLLIQGNTVAIVAKVLHLVNNDNEHDSKDSAFGVNFNLPEEVKLAMYEIIVTKASLRFGNKLIDIPIPKKSLVVMVNRSGYFFVPDGNSIIEQNDILLIIADDEDALSKALQDLGAEGYIVKHLNDSN